MRVIELKKPVAITAWSCVGGKMEKEGPLAAGFDILSGDDYFGQKSWEKAETAMQKYSLRSLMEKRNINARDIDMALGGDLCNQITSTGFAYRDYMIPFAGMYGACSTMSLTMATAACLISGGIVNDNVVIGFFVAFAMPTAGLASTFADMYQGDSKGAVVFTLGSTMLSIVTIPLLYGLLTLFVGG